MKFSTTLGATALTVGMLFGATAMAQGSGSATIDAIVKRGELVCGVAGATAGFSLPDSQGVMRGIDADIVSQISEMKREPAWMRDFRLKSLEIFNSKPMPHWGGDIAVNFQDIFYYLKPTEQQGKTWEEVPDAIERLIDTYIAKRESADEPFIAAYRRLGDAPFKEALYGHS